jgi:hypothetical protein
MNDIFRWVIFSDIYGYLDRYRWLNWYGQIRVMRVMSHV